MSKKSIRFYTDRQVRAVWDEEHSKWWFSAVDIVGAINNESDYKKCRNYWKYLKGKMAKSGVELVSVTNQFKFYAPDGKQRSSDALDMECIQTLAKNYPNNRAAAFLDWLIYSDNSIDGQSKKKAYQLFESDILDNMCPGTIESLQQIHAYLFGGLYDFAGKIRTKTISKGGTVFCRTQYLMQNLLDIERMPDNNYDEILDKYIEMNMAHPFMEGNGRSTRIWLDLILKKSLKLCVDWSRIDQNAYMDTMRRSAIDPAPIKSLIRNALTDKINDREIFMKGIDYSYYYEQD